MDLSDERIVFDTEVNTRVPPIHERHAPCGPVDLVMQKSNPECEFFWVVGRPPDSLAFARSDRSGRHQRRVLLFLLRDLCRFGDLRKQQLIEFLSQDVGLNYPDLAPDHLAVLIDDHRRR